MRTDRTAEELNKVIGPEFINYKNTGYSKEPYVEGWAAIHIANRIFGYNGWSSEIKQLEIVDVEESDGRATVTSRAQIRITLVDGSFREDIGFGMAERVKGKGKAIKQSQKSSITDAIKRTLRQFGSALGNCCYDKHYIQAIQKIRPQDRPSITEEDLVRMDSAAPAARGREKPAARPYTHTPRTALATPSFLAPPRSPSKVPQLDDVTSSQELQ